MEALTSSRLITGEGTAESAWRKILEFRQVPCHPLDWWITDTARLVVLAPHPDDEILTCGALLHQHALRGGDYLLVAATDGEASHEPTAQRSTRQLAAARRAETLQGLQQLGLSSKNMARLGLPDGRLQQYVANLRSALEHVLRPTDLLVTTYALDGHPDHEACGEAAKYSCARVNCRLAQAPVWLWHWAEPTERSIPWAKLHGFNIPASSQANKQRALAEHATQMAASGANQSPILGPSILQRSERSSEYFFI